MIAWNVFKSDYKNKKKMKVLLARCDFVLHTAKQFLRMKEKEEDEDARRAFESIKAEFLIRFHHVSPSLLSSALLFPPKRRTRIFPHFLPGWSKVSGRERRRKI